MSGYLYRLVTRASPADVAVAGPSIRSASPVVEYDQRLSVPGFQDIEEAAAQGETGAAEELPAARPPAAGTRPPIAGSTGATIQREAAVPVTARAAPPDAPAAVYTRVEHIGTEEHRALPAKNVERPEDMAATEAQPPASDPDHVEPAPPIVRDAPEGTIPAAPPRVAVRTEAPLVRSTFRQSGSLVAEAAAAPPDAAPVEEAGAAPRIEIGRINVEVVPDPEPQKSVPPARGPLTAASVSVIGKLGGRVRPSRYLSLRHR